MSKNLSKTLLSTLTKTPSTTFQITSTRHFLTKTKIQTYDLEYNQGFRRGIFIISCVDPRLPKVTEEITDSTLADPYNPKHFNVRVVATDFDVTDKPIKNMINTIGNLIKSQGGENLLIIGHDNCYGIESGSVEGLDKHDYTKNLKKQIMELLKNPEVFTAVKNGKLKFSAALYSHDRSVTDNVQTYQININDKDEIEIQHTGKFRVDPELESKDKESESKEKRLEFKTRTTQTTGTGR